MTEEIINLRSLIEGKNNIFYCEVDKCNVVQKLKQENETLNYQWHKQSEIGDEWYKVAEKYRSALEEIREIADKCKECLNEDDDCGCDYLRIKRRIDEVLGDE